MGTLCNSNIVRKNCDDWFYEITVSQQLFIAFWNNKGENQSSEESKMGVHDMLDESIAD